MLERSKCDKNLCLNLAKIKVSHFTVGFFSDCATGSYVCFGPLVVFENSHDFCVCACFFGAFFSICVSLEAHSSTAFFARHFREKNDVPNTL